MVVVLPAPLRPRRPTTSPGERLNETSARAVVVPKVFDRPLALITGLHVALPLAPASRRRRGGHVPAGLTGSPAGASCRIGHRRAPRPPGVAGTSPGIIQMADRWTTVALI